MELSKYVSKKIKVDINNGYYYEGICQTADNNSLTLIDKKKNKVEIKETIILLITEVNN